MTAGRRYTCATDADLYYCHVRGAERADATQAHDRGRDLQPASQFTPVATLATRMLPFRQLEKTSSAGS